MLSKAPPSFDLLREHVEDLIESGHPFTDVEREIDSSALSQDQRAALWLLAWSLGGAGPAPAAEPSRPRLTLLR